MEIINVEYGAYQAILAKIRACSESYKLLKESVRDKSLKTWFDNQDVCYQLNISMRTLQSYRDRGLIGFSQIGQKIYYRSEDIENFINNHKKEK